MPAIQPKGGVYYKLPIPTPNVMAMAMAMALPLGPGPDPGHGHGHGQYQADSAYQPGYSASLLSVDCWELERSIRNEGLGVGYWSAFNKPLGLENDPLAYASWN